MNAQRRKKLDEINGTLAEARAELETLRDEEQEYYDNMPESFQNGERGQKAQEAIDAMETVIGDLENIELSDIGA